MSMIKICQLNSEDCLKQAEAIIRSGGILVYPTDTLYGLGVDARNDSAVEKLSTLKRRKGPWSVSVSDIEMLNTYAEIPLDKIDFVMSHIPGKVTFIFRAKISNLSHHILGEKNTIGMRIPDHPFPIKLAERLQFPVTSTSVNRTGENPINDPKMIANLFGNEIDMIVDDGILPPSGGSRIYDFSGKKITILRNS